MPLSNYDITSYFNQAGKALGEGLHMEYWIRHSARDTVDVKIEIIVLANDTEAMENLNAFADTLFFDLYENNKRAISRLKEERKGVYEKLIHASARPIALQWELPHTIDFTIAEDSTALDQHLFCFEDGSFKTSLNSWENGIVTEELANGANDLPEKMHTLANLSTITSDSVAKKARFNSPLCLKVFPANCHKMIQAAPAHHGNRLYQALSSKNKNHPPTEFILSIGGS